MSSRNLLDCSLTKRTGDLDESRRADPYKDVPLEKVWKSIDITFCFLTQLDLHKLCNK